MKDRDICEVTCVDSHKTTRLQILIEKERSLRLQRFLKLYRMKRE